MSLSAPFVADTDDLIVLLNLSNKLGKRDKMRGLPRILSLFRNKINRFNYTGAGMLYSIYHMTLKLCNFEIGVLPYRRDVAMGVNFHSITKI